MSLRRLTNAVPLAPGLAASLATLLAATCLAPRAATAQTSFIAPDGRNRYPGVTIFCPSGTGVAPCSFGGSGGAGGGAVTVNLPSGSVSSTNRFPVSDAALDGLVAGGALSVAGTIALSGSPPVSLAAGSNAVGSVTVSNLPSVQPVSGAVSQAGSWMMGLSAGSTVGLSTGASVALAAGSSVAVASLPALPAGGNAIGSVSVSNLPAIQPISGAVSQSGSWVVGLSSGTNVGLSAGSSVALAAGTSVGVGSLPALPVGSNAIGSVSVSNLPTVQPISGAVSEAGSWTVGLSSGASVSLATGSNTIGQVGVTALPAIPAGGNAIGTVGVTSLPPLPAGSNAIGTMSVANFPVTQPVSAISLPLPAGAATAALQTAPLGPVAPAAATATSSVVIGCLANTVLPSFSAGQQGAVPCDTSGRPYVVTVPSANNVPAYLQAVSSGGAGIYRAINAASSAMAANVKTTTGMVYGYEACNSGAAAAYLRLFALTAAPTVGTSVPQVSKLLAAGSCQSVTTSIGLVFNTGIAVDVTSGSMADSDTASVATANQVSLEVYYK